jgi:hypothetical protein
MTAAAGFHHHAQRHHGQAQVGRFGLHRGAHAAQFVHPRDHRRHHLDRPMRPGAQHGAQLRHQHLALGQPHANAAQAQRRVFLGRDRQIGRGLVAPDIEQTDDQGRPSSAWAIAV